MIPPQIAQSRYVSLVTFRRDGTARPTPVWAAEDAGELVVWTRSDSWKVKRLARDARVTVTPCDARGNPVRGAVPAEGTGRLLEDDQMPRVRKALTHKYGWQFRLLDTGGALLRRGRRPHVGIAVSL